MFQRCEIGTEIQDKSGRVKKKVEDIDGAKWVGRNRYNWMMHHKKDLTENDKVYHIDGDKGNDDPSNLVAIRFSAARYSLKHSRVVWVPKNSKTQIPKFTLKRESVAA